MKKLIILLIGFLIANSLIAQVPQKMSYQAVIRNASGNLVISSPVAMRISILQGSTTGTVVYSEIHNPTTNANGLVAIEIGGGTSLAGTFSSISWGSGIFFLKTETDPSNGTDYSVVGVSQFLSVPYALEAKNSQTSKSASDGFKSVSALGDTLYMNNGKFIIIPGLSNSNPTASTGITAHVCGATNVHNAAISYNNYMEDQEGNLYRTVQIGTQTWMAENLRTTKYQNMKPIPYVNDNITWQNLTSGAYCDYNNNATSVCPYGKLYNWYAVNSTDQLCPNGWHMPTNAEWDTLITFLGGSSVAGGKMKANGTQFWTIPNAGATNSSGWSGLPGGNRNVSGVFYELNERGYWWSSTQNFSGSARAYVIRYDVGFSGFFSDNHKFGYSVRCLKN